MIGIFRKLKVKVENIAFIEEKKENFKNKIKEDMKILNEFNRTLSEERKEKGLIVKNFLSRNKDIVENFYIWFNYAEKECIDGLPSEGPLLDLVKQKGFEEDKVYHLESFFNFDANLELNKLRELVIESEDEELFLSLLEDIVNQNILTFSV